MHNSRIAVIASPVPPATIVAQEKKIQRADLPPAVEKTVAAQTQGATIKGFSRKKKTARPSTKPKPP